MSACASSTASESAPARKEPFIFIVDDDMAMGPLIMEALVDEGYKVQLFHDPLQAARVFAAAKPKPDVLITDSEMPGLHSLELVERCRRISPNLRFIMASGHTDERLRRLYAVQPDYVFQKPHSVEHLLAAVRELVGEPGCG